MGQICRVVIPHPLGGCSHEQILQKALDAVDDVERMASTPSDVLTEAHFASCTISRSTGQSGGLAKRISVENSYEAIWEYLQRAGLGDGLPVVPPTEERVKAMLGWTDREPSDVLALVPPNGADATVEKVAANAVLAGCKPMYLPIVLAAVELICQPEFDLLGVQATTHPVAPLLIVNGPIAREAGIQSGAGLFGAGFHANATIGRALRLVMMNIGGAIPGVTDKATHGQPSKFSYCIAENEDASPWEPLHVELGYPPDASAITVVPGESPHNIHDAMSSTAEALLQTVCGAIAQTGSNNSLFGDDVNDYLVIFGPEHAQTIARSGFTKEDARRYIFQHARTPLRNWSPEVVRNLFQTKFPDLYPDSVLETAMVPIVPLQGNIHILVAGGSGKHSMHVPTLGSLPSITAPLRLASGAFARSLEEFRRPAASG
jgi:hypothetical protein